MPIEATCGSFFWPNTSGNVQNYIKRPSVMYHTLQMTGRDRVKLTDINFEYVGQFY